MSAPLMAVYGATGHTGRLVAAELIARGRDVILAGRDDAGSGPSPRSWAAALG